MDARYWIDTLGLTAHPEGGHFREVYRASEGISGEALPARFQAQRSFSTGIYYLLQKGDFSAFHRIKQDELWHFYDGSPFRLITMASQRVTVHRLGRDPSKGQLPLCVIPAGTLFAVALEPKASWGLAGCTVAPGFDFADFEMPGREDLLLEYPEHRDWIERHTR
jgi:predicted cupin superfamily sugar epimerase